MFFSDCAPELKKFIVNQIGRSGSPDDWDLKRKSALFATLLTGSTSCDRLGVSAIAVFEPVGDAVLASFADSLIGGTRKPSRLEWECLETGGIMLAEILQQTKGM